MGLPHCRNFWGKVCLVTMEKLLALLCLHMTLDITMGQWSRVGFMMVLSDRGLLSYWAWWYCSCYISLLFLWVLAPMTTNVFLLGCFLLDCFFLLFLLGWFLREECQWVILNLNL